VAELSLNYEYVFQRAQDLAATPNPRILDYGIGLGELIFMGRERNVDVHGVDRPGIETSDRAKVIDEDGRIPYDDNSFDVVVSNQVFEHIQDAPTALREIHRVLKPGGTFLALFPDNTVWFEGHTGLYFVHWLMPYPELLRPYLVACHKMGLGYARGDKTAAEWADWVRWLMETDVYYHRGRDVQKWWAEIFGAKPESMAHDWMQYRIVRSHRLKRFQNITAQSWMSPLLDYICRIRAGLVIKTRKI
jgi:SAM-dependent methyltransferase